LPQNERHDEPEHRRLWTVPTRRDDFGAPDDEVEVDNEIAAAQWDARCWRERP